ncbi:Phosphatidylinositol N-acetylglucosaminyltransferase subunit gpi15 [Paramyrothecium foliicola]|nr:Phosphatidylinositol N-acetylglucosaminyltransferase subunit gpi15 [Paramyrothecium foliicola]
MFSSAPHLCIRRPSPTTAEFTVTTLPPQTLGLRFLRLLLLLLRVTLALALACLLALRLGQAIDPSAAAAVPASSQSAPRASSWLLSGEVVWLTWATRALLALRRSEAGLALAPLAARPPLWLLLPAAAAAFYVLSLRVHARESLLVLRGLGVQTSESPATYLASPATRFIPTEKIQDVFINEAFRGFEVRYYLVVVVEGEEDVVVVFPGLLPRRKIVETVWRGVRECLYETKAEEKAQLGL